MKKYIKDSKMRKALRSMAMVIDTPLSLGKNQVTPEFIDAVSENIKKNELIKISVLKNCDIDIREAALVIAERSQSEIVEVIGRKIVLYKPDPEKTGKL